MDIASLASQHGKDGSQTPLSGLQTPPSAFERHRNSIHRVAHAPSQPSIADSPSPVNSIYLQRQSSTLSPQSDIILYASTDEQRANSRTQAHSPTCQGDVVPWSSSDGLQQPAPTGRQHQLYMASASSHPSLLPSSQGQWSSNPALMLEPNQGTQQQQLHYPAAPPVAHQPRGFGTAPDSPLQQPRLVSAPPSASWSRELPKDNCLDTQMAASLSFLAIAGHPAPSCNSSCTCPEKLPAYRRSPLWLRMLMSSV